MATITATGSDFSFTSRRSGSTWSEQTNAVAFNLNLPGNAIVSNAVLTFDTTSPICGGSNFTVDGNSTGTGSGRSVAIGVADGAASVTVTFSFKGSGTDYTEAKVTVSNMALTVTYDVPVEPEVPDEPEQGHSSFSRAENGRLVSYGLYRAENGKLVPYSLYRAESGKLVKY